MHSGSTGITILNSQVMKVTNAIDSLLIFSFEKVRSQCIWLQTRVKTYLYAKHTSEISGYIIVVLVQHTKCAASARVTISGTAAVFRFFNTKVFLA